MVELENEADVARPPARQLRLGHPRYLLVADPDLALARRIKPCNQVEQCRLARAGRPHQTDILARLNVEAQVVEHVDLLAAAGEKLVHIPDADNWLTHLSTSFEWIASRSSFPNLLVPKSPRSQTPVW